MKPTTEIDVSGLQMSVSSVDKTPAGIIARITTNHAFSPSGEDWLNRQAEGPKGAGEIISVTPMPGARVVLLEFAQDVTRETALLATGRFLNNIKRTCPADPSYYYGMTKFVESLYGEPFSPMAISSVTSPWDYTG